MNDFVSDMVDFEEYLKNKNLSGSYVYLVSSAVKKFLLTQPDITKIDSYNEFIFEFGVKKRSNYVYDSLKLYIRWKFDKDPRGQSLIRNLLKPKPQDPKKVIRYLDEQTREQVIGMIKDYKHRLIAKLQNITGVRAGDVFRLKRGSISYEAYEDKVVMRIDFEGKGRKRFVKWIFDETLQGQIDLFIQSNYVDAEYYFMEKRTNSDANMQYLLNYRRYWADLKQALTMMGVTNKEWATHDFRRSFAREVWNNTKDPSVLKEMLNHQQFDTTLRYLRGSGLQTKDVYLDMADSRKKNLGR